VNEEVSTHWKNGDAYDALTLFTIQDDIVYTASMETLQREQEPLRFEVAKRGFSSRAAVSGCPFRTTMDQFGI